MKQKTILAILALILASMACGTYVTVTPDPTAILPTVTLSPTLAELLPTATARVIPTEQQAATIVQPFVNVRSAPDGDVIGFLRAGDMVSVLSCSELWCEIETPAGYVWKGCLTIESELGCSAR